MSVQNPWKTLSSRSVYNNDWITVNHNEVITPGKTAGIYGKVHFKNLAVGIIPLDDNHNTWIVGQYRYTIDRYSWEIPEGGSPEGADPLLSAQRELLEETGISAKKWDKIMELHTSNSVTDEFAQLYLARDLSFGEAMPEETELLQVRKLPFGELLDMVHQDIITDAMSVAAILKVDWMIRNGQVL